QVVNFDRHKTEKGACAGRCPPKGARRTAGRRYSRSVRLGAARRKKRAFAGWTRGLNRRGRRRKIKPGSRQIHTNVRAKGASITISARAPKALTSRKRARILRRKESCWRWPSVVLAQTPPVLPIGRADDHSTRLYEAIW